MTQEQIDAFNRNQHSGEFHPLTCGNYHGYGEKPKEEYPPHDDGEGILVGTPDGLKCPYCDYTQSFGQWEADLTDLGSQILSAHPPSSP